MGRDDEKGCTPRVRPDIPRGELSIKEHVLMVNDRARGDKYYQAMKAKIRPGDVVLEVGTGAGLLSCIAVSLGAKRVYTVEGSPVLHQVAQKVFAANGVADKITLLNVHSKDLTSLAAIAEPIDVFVTETIGGLGLDEGIVPVFDHVRSFLAPGAKVIPEDIRFNQCLVNMSGIREQVEVMQPVLGFDLSALNEEIEHNHVYWLQPIDRWREVSTTGQSPAYDLLHFSAGESEHKMQILGDHVCDGMLTWTEFKLAEHVFLETRCRHLGDSWANSVDFMRRQQVTGGQSCTSRIRIREDKVSWLTTWDIEPR